MSFNNSIDHGELNEEDHRILRDPQADKFRQVVNKKIKEFRTLK